MAYGQPIAKLWTVGPGVLDGRYVIMDRPGSQHRYKWQFRSRESLSSKGLSNRARPCVSDPIPKMGLLTSTSRNSLCKIMDRYICDAGQATIDHVPVYGQYKLQEPLHLHLHTMHHVAPTIRTSKASCLTSPHSGSIDINQTLPLLQALLPSSRIANTSRNRPCFYQQDFPNIPLYYDNVSPLAYPCLCVARCLQSRPSSTNTYQSDGFSSGSRTATSQTSTNTENHSNAGTDGSTSLSWNDISNGSGAVDEQATSDTASTSYWVTGAGAQFE
jgi:hypothetical protein